MKSADDRIKEAVAGAPGELSAADAYRRVIHFLEKNLDEFEEVWGPRFDPTDFASRRAARRQLLDDMLLVQALLANHTGTTIPQAVAVTRRRPNNGY